jgi:MYXO-CTERM domain-containing protein
LTRLPAERAGAEIAPDAEVAGLGTLLAQATAAAGDVAALGAGPYATPAGPGELEFDAPGAGRSFAQQAEPGANSGQAGPAGLGGGAAGGSAPWPLDPVATGVGRGSGPVPQRIASGQGPGVAVVPEPDSRALWTLGLAALAWLARRRRA